MKKILFVSNCSFLLLFIIVAWNNRLAADDYHFLANVHHYGIIQGTITEYNTWSTRYTSVLLNHFVLSFAQYKYTLFIFGITEIAAFIGSFAFLLKTIFSQYGQSISIKETIGISILFVNGYFYTVIGINETWFWLCSSCTYIWSIIFFFLGTGMLLNTTIKPLFRYAVLAISFIYIGGAIEVFAALLLLGLSLTIVLLVKHTDKRKYFTGIYIALFFCLAATIVLVIGHGNTVRQQFTLHTNPIGALGLNFKLLGIYALHQLPHVLQFTILFSLPFLYIGHMFSIRNNIIPKSAQHILIQLFKFALLYALLLYVQNYPTTYLLGDIGPGRSFSFISLYTFLLVAGSCFYIGFYSSASILKRMWLALILCIGLNSWNLVEQYSITTMYAMKYDQRMQLLDAKSNKTGAIELDALSPSGMLYSADNQVRFLQDGKDLKCTVKLKNQP